MTWISESKYGKLAEYLFPMFFLELITLYKLPKYNLNLPETQTHNFHPFDEQQTYFLFGGFCGLAHAFMPIGVNSKDDSFFLVTMLDTEDSTELDTSDELVDTSTYVYVDNSDEYDNLVDPNNIDKSYNSDTTLNIILDTEKLGCD